MKNEIAIGQTQELQIKKAKNQLSTVFSLIQSDEAIRLVNILKRIETDKGIEFLCSFENINWSVELIEKYKDQWDWFYLSRNTSLPWSIELFEKYKDQWHWRELSRNTSLPWSIELFEKYKDQWDWRELSENESLPWSIELIEKYKDQWDWGWGGLSSNTSLPWSIELIEKYKDQWDWRELSWNESIHWPKLSINMVDEIMQYNQ